VVFLQVAAILAACQLAHLVTSRLRQPAVIGQLIAGVLIGPSVLGALAPSWQHALFPAASLGIIQTLGYMGVSLYMFDVGAGLDLGVVRRTIRTGLGVSVVGTALPLVAGALLALPISRDPRLVPAATPAHVACAFLAVTFAVTAFPVMARILSDRGLLHTPIASLALGCGCFSDAAAWCLLAIVVAGVGGSTSGAVMTLVGTVGLVAAIQFGARPLLARLAVPPSPLAASPRLEVLVLVVIMLVAWISEAIGLHPAFGAFVLGVAMPRCDSTRALCQRTTPLATGLLLPLFFAYAGLHTRLDLIDSPDLIVLTLVVVVVACVTKGGGSSLIARLTGLSARDSVAVGVLMNARGLVELIVLTVGLERHVITPTLFAVLVVMTVATTLIPSPVLSLLYGRVDAAGRVDAPLEAIAPTKRTA
jgi:Kef-type K+ transport system membrane component KefB